MTRQSDRESAAALLSGLSIFQAVFAHPVRDYGGQSPVASISSRGLRAEGATRGGGATLLSTGLAVVVAVRADPGSEAAAETSLDTLVEAAALALVEDDWTLDTSDALPDGAPYRNVDGVIYRVERLLITR